MTAENKSYVGTGIFGLFRREVEIIDKGEGEIFGDTPPNHDKVLVVYKKGIISRVVSGVFKKGRGLDI